jgi:hypothetical protein
MEKNNGVNQDGALALVLNFQDFTSPSHWIAILTRFNIQNTGLKLLWGQSAISYAFMFSFLKV